MPAYASTVTWDTMDEYERYIKQCIDVGFTAFKLHAWGDAKEDAKLSRNLRKWTGPDADLMFDGSAGWDYVTSMWFGRVLEDCGFLWYEEPMREFELGSYRKLCDALDIPVLAAETSDGCHWNMATWIQMGALDMTRVNTNFKGGFTGSMKIAHLSDSHGMRCQVHGMGLANAQLCAAIRVNDYYEQLVINEEQIDGLKNLGKLAIVDGDLNVSSEPGSATTSTGRMSSASRWRAPKRCARRRVELRARSRSSVAASPRRTRSANLSDSRFWAYYLLLPKPRPDLRRRALPDTVGHRPELPRNAAQPARPRNRLRRTEALSGDDRRSGVLAVVAQHHRSGPRARCIGELALGPRQRRCSSTAISPASGWRRCSSCCLGSCRTSSPAICGR